MSGGSSLLYINKGQRQELEKDQPLLVLYVYVAVISRYVNASAVRAVPFTVVFWQEKKSGTQSKLVTCS